MVISRAWLYSKLRLIWDQTVAKHDDPIPFLLPSNSPVVWAVALPSWVSSQPGWKLRCVHSCWVSLQWISVGMLLARLCSAWGGAARRGEEDTRQAQNAKLQPLDCATKTSPKSKCRSWSGNAGKARHYVFLAKCLHAVLSAGTQEHFLASEVRYALTLCPDSWTSAQQHHMEMRLPGSLHWR